MDQMLKIENAIYQIGKWTEMTHQPEAVEPLLDMHDKFDQILPNMAEEVEETIVANVNADIVELLDGVCDQLFVLLQQADALEAVGVDVWGALNAVCENNNLKFFWEYEDALKAMPEIEKKYGEAVIFERELESGEVWYGVRRLADGKILKPVNHPKVELRPFIPAELL